MSTNRLPYLHDIEKRFTAEFHPDNTAAVKSLIAELAVETAATKIVAAEAEEIERQRILALDNTTVDAGSAIEIREWTAGLRHEETVSGNRHQFARYLLTQATANP